MPALTTVASTLWAPVDGRSEFVERTSRRTRARPRATGWRESANTCSEVWLGSGAAVTGKVMAIASRWGSTHTSEVPMPTLCSSFAPSGP